MSFQTVAEATVRINQSSTLNCLSYIMLCRQKAGFRLFNRQHLSGEQLWS